VGGKVCRAMIYGGSNLGARSELNDTEDEERTLSRLVTASAIYSLPSGSPYKEAISPHIPV